MFQKLRLYFKRLRQNAHWLVGDTTEYLDIDTYPSIANQKLREPQPIVFPVARLVYEEESVMECTRQRALEDSEAV